MSRLETCTERSDSNQGQSPRDQCLEREQHRGQYLLLPTKVLASIVHHPSTIYHRPSSIVYRLYIIMCI